MRRTLYSIKVIRYSVYKIVYDLTTVMCQSHDITTLTLSRGFFTGLLAAEAVH